MNVFAEVYNPAGSSKLGVIKRIVSLTRSEKLDSLGSASITVPASDPISNDLLSIRRKIILYYVDPVRHKPVYITQGKLLTRRYSTNAGEKNVTWEISDPLFDFSDPLTGRNLFYGDDAFARVLYELVRPVAGWSASSDPGIGGVTAKFNNLSLQAALRFIAAVKGLHLRVSSPNRLHIGALGESSGLRIANIGNVSHQLQNNANIAFIETLELVHEGRDMFNVIVPLAGGQNGAAAMTLKRATRVEPYLIQTQTAPDGMLEYYLEDEDSIATYGRIERQVFLPQAVPIEATSLGAIIGANVLYDWAAVELARHAEPQVAYQATVRKLDQRVLPGDKVRVDYTGGLFQDGELVSFADIHQDLWVLSIREAIAGDRAVTMELSNVDVTLADQDDMLADAYTRTDAVRVQLISQHFEEADQINQTMTIDPSTPGEVTIELPLGTFDIAQGKALLVITREDFQGPDTLSVWVDGIQITESIDGLSEPFLGGSGSDTVTLDIEDALTANPVTKVDIQDPHTIRIECVNQGGELTLRFDIVCIVETAYSDLYTRKIAYHEEDDSDVDLQGPLEYQILENEYFLAAVYGQRRVRLYLSKVGDPQGDLTVAIYSKKWDFGQLIATSNVVRAWSVGTEPSYINFEFTELINLKRGLYMVRLLTTDTQDDDNYIVWRADSDLGSLADGLVVAYDFETFEDGDLLTDDMISYWDLQEGSGTRADSHGSNDLTDNNTVTSTTGIQGNAASFAVASSEWLSRASNASLQTGNIDFMFAGWFNLNSKGANRRMLGKWGVAPGLEYLLFFQNAADRFRFQVSNDGTATVTVDASALGSPSTGTWYFIVVWHDATNNVIGIRVNNGTANTTAHTTGVFTGTDDFTLSDSGGFFDGKMDEIGFWKRILSDDEQTWLYNAGSGRTYLDIVNRPAPPVITDLYSTNDLTAQGVKLLPSVISGGEMAGMYGAETVKVEGVIPDEQALSHADNFRFHFRLDTLPDEGETIEISFRHENINDSDWFLEISHGGGLRLVKHVFTTVPPFTNTTMGSTGVHAGELIEVIGVSSSIRVIVNGHEYITVTDAHNSTENFGEARVESGQISDYYAYPYVPSSVYLYRDSGADLSIGDENFTWAAWVMFPGLCTQDENIISKWVGTKEYKLWRKNSTNRMMFSVSNDGAATVEISADGFGALEAGKKYLVAGWHDATSNQIAVYVNGVINKVSHTTGVNAGSNQFRIGDGFAGWVDKAYLWNRVLSEAELGQMLEGGEVVTDGMMYAKDASGNWGPLSKRADYQVYGR